MKFQISKKYLLLTVSIFLLLSLESFAGQLTQNQYMTRTSHFYNAGSWVQQGHVQEMYKINHVQFSSPIALEFSVRLCSQDGTLIGDAIELKRNITIGSTPQTVSFLKEFLENATEEFIFNFPMGPIGRDPITVKNKSTGIERSLVDIYYDNQGQTWNKFEILESKFDMNKKIIDVEIQPQQKFGGFWGGYSLKFSFYDGNTNRYKIDLFYGYTRSHTSTKSIAFQTELEAQLFLTYLYTVEESVKVILNEHTPYWSTWLEDSPIPNIFITSNVSIFDKETGKSENLPDLLNRLKTQHNQRIPLITQHNQNNPQSSGLWGWIPSLEYFSVATSNAPVVPRMEFSHNAEEVTPGVVDVPLLEDHQSITSLNSEAEYSQVRQPRKRR